jgi:hypothetical protein
MTKNYTVVGKGRCQVKNDTIYTVLLSDDAGREWMFIALTMTPTPLITNSRGIFYEVVKKRYTLEKATALYLKAVEAFENANVSALRKLCRHWERNDEYICWALGLTTEEQALAMKTCNEQQAALHRAFRAGDLSRDEYLRMSEELSGSLKNR